MRADPGAARALDDVLDLDQGQPARLRGQLVRGEPPGDFGDAALEIAREIGAGLDVRPRHGHHLRPRRARVHLGRDFLRRGRDEQDQGRRAATAGSEAQRARVVMFWRSAAPRPVRGSEGVRVVDDHGHRARGQAIGSDQRVEHDQRSRGVGRERALEAERLAERLLALGVGEHEAGGHVVGHDDRPPRAQAAQSFGEGHERRPEGMDVAHVAVEEEQVRRAGVVALEDAGGEPGGNADVLHASSLRRCTPSALPIATSAPSRAGEDWIRAGARAWRSRTAPARVQEIDAAVRRGGDHERARGDAGGHDRPARRRLEPRLAGGEVEAVQVPFVAAEHGDVAGQAGRRIHGVAERAAPGFRPVRDAHGGHAAVESAHDRRLGADGGSGPDLGPELGRPDHGAGGGVEGVERPVVAAAQHAPGRQRRRGEDRAQLPRPDRLALRVHGHDRARALRVHAPGGLARRSGSPVRVSCSARRPSSCVRGVAVDGQRSEVAGALEDRQLARLRVAHGAQEEGEQAEELGAVGRADRARPHARSPCARQSALRSARAPLCSMSVSTRVSVALKNAAMSFTVVCLLTSATYAAGRLGAATDRSIPVSGSSSRMDPTPSGM